MASMEQENERLRAKLESHHVSDAHATRRAYHSLAQHVEALASSSTEECSTDVEIQEETDDT
eukprot:jgi/Pico_ML_1/50588/g1773.t1